jgi:hypothetical protein
VSRPSPRRFQLNATVKGQVALSATANVLCHADVAELADAPGLGPGIRKGVWVRIPPSAPKHQGTHGQAVAWRGAIQPTLGPVGPSHCDACDP